MYLLLLWKYNSQPGRGDGYRKVPLACLLPTNPHPNPKQEVPLASLLTPTLAPSKAPLACLRTLIQQAKGAARLPPNPKKP